MADACTDPDLLTKLLRALRSLRQIYSAHRPGKTLGLPIDRYSDEEAGLLYRGIGAHIGAVVSQNAKGDLLSTAGSRAI